MKRICVFISALILLCSCTVLTASASSPLFRFTCVSDLHLDDVLIQGTHSNRDQFRALLQSSCGKGYSDLFVCDGDVSSYGSTKVWEEAREYVAAAGYTNMLWALGNHGYGTVVENADGDEDFKKFIDGNSIYYHKVINGYHFICMAAEKSDIYVISSEDVYSDEQINWLRQEIVAAAADSDGKPVFVLSHYPMSGNGVGDALIPVLSRYQNVFFFWGHEHSSGWTSYTLNDYVSTDEGFVNARTGCLQYGNSNQADALLVDVFADKVTLTYDRTDGSQMAPNSITIPLETWFSCADGQLSWCLPWESDTQVLLCSYDALGRVTSVTACSVTPHQRQYADVTASDGITKLFIVDSQLRPLYEATDYPVKLSA